MIRGLLVAVLAASPLCAGWSQSGTAAPLPVPSWAVTLARGTEGAAFVAVAADAAGNVYAAGSLIGTEPYDFGNNVTATATVPPKQQYYAGTVLLVKYSSTGKALWARTLRKGSELQELTGVAVDAQGNVIVVGYTRGNGSFDFGDRASVQNPDAKGYNPLVIKYDSSGKALWSRTASSPAQGRFMAVSAGADGSIYAAGYVEDAGMVDFGNGVRIEAKDSGAVVVKYDPEGTPRWVAATPGGASYFLGAAADKSGAVYASGELDNQALLAKFDPRGALQWTRTTVSGQYESQYAAVAVDDSGAVYVSGQCGGNVPYDFGNGVRATGAAEIGERDRALRNFLLVKYGADGLPLWANTMEAGEAAWFTGVAAARGGGVYACGNMFYGTPYGFGDGVTASGASGAGENTVLVKYGPSGKALWAWPLFSSPKSGSANWDAVAVDASGAVYSAGHMDGPGAYGLSPGVTVQGSVTDADGHNPLLMKSRDDSPSPDAAAPYTNSVATLTDSRVRLRSAPGLPAATLSYLSRGDKVEVIEMSPAKQKIGSTDDYWYKVRTPDGREGWTYGGFLDVER